MITVLECPECERRILKDLTPLEIFVDIIAAFPLEDDEPINGSDAVDWVCGKVRDAREIKELSIQRFCDHESEPKQVEIEDDDISRLTLSLVPEVMAVMHGRLKHLSRRDRSMLMFLVLRAGSTALLTELHPEDLRIVELHLEAALKEVKKDV